MFDIGFWEILLIGVVTLLVVGPDRLPGLAVFAGHWIGRLRRFANHMRDEISEELEAEHLKKLLAEQNRELDELRRDVDDVRREARGDETRGNAPRDDDAHGRQTGGDAAGDGEMHAAGREPAGRDERRRDEDA